MTSKMIEELRAESYVNAVTYRRNGRAVATPLWFAVVDDRLYAFTDGTSAKVKRLRHTARVALAACTAGGTPKGDWYAGEGGIVTDQDVERRAYEALRRKYGWQMKSLDLLSWLGGRIGRRVVLELQPGRRLSLDPREPSG